ncbi:MAG: FGGY-family carbohydrate kinase [Desulfatibacillaceae bacterium]
MSEKDLLLCIDNGTQSLRALVFDLEGNLVAKRRAVFEPYFSRQPGWAEQDPEVYWNACREACNGLWEEERVDKGRLAGLSVTTQRGTVVCMGRDGKPLRPAILWLDQRRDYGQRPLGGAWGALFRLAGVSETVLFFQQEAEANWLASHEKDTWRNTHKYLLLSGYLSYRLTGEYVDSTACQVAFIPFDYKKSTWAPSWDWKWKVLPVTPEMLPELKQPGEQLGAVTPEAARQTGIPEGLPVIAAAADKACEVIGSGGSHPSIGCLSYGTTATVNILHDRFISPVAFLPPYPAPMPDKYCVEVQIFRGYWMVSWFKEEFAYQERMEAMDKGMEPEVLFEKLVGETPPGAMGLMLQPYWTPGIRHPGPEGKGAIIGFGDVHHRGHVYRAILEGLAYALREGKERIEAKSRVPITTLAVSGGGSQSDNAMRITADVFGLPAARPHLYETSGLGAAVDCAVGLGLHDGFDSALAAMTRAGDVFEPDMANHRLYDELYNEVYMKMYKNLKPLYKKIREITGYPR